MNPESDRILNDLLLYARTGKVEKLIACLDLSGFPLDGDCGHGWTLLVTAASRGRPAAVDALLSRGADFRRCTYEGHTALMHAAFRGSAECIELLLSAGADVNQKDRDGRTALDFAHQARREEVATLLAPLTEDPWSAGDSTWIRRYDPDLVRSIVVLVDRALAEGERGAVQPLVDVPVMPEWYRHLIASVPLAGISFRAEPSSSSWGEWGRFITAVEFQEWSQSGEFDPIVSRGAVPFAFCSDGNWWTIPRVGEHRGAVGIWVWSDAGINLAYDSFPAFLESISPNRRNS